jgi:hypothetical protein
MNYLVPKKPIGKVNMLFRAFELRGWLSVRAN